MGLTVVPRVEIRSGWVLPILRRVSFYRPTVGSSLGPLAHLLVGVSQPYYTPHYLTKRSWQFTCVNPSEPPLARFQLRLPEAKTFVICMPSGSLLTTDVIGVRHPFTWGQWDRIHWKGHFLPSTR
jgi:hypothetical protein